MSDISTTVRLSVLAGGDPLREERLTRQLLEHLNDFDGVRAEFEESPISVDGGKGTVGTVLAVLAVLVPTVKPVSEVLVIAIKEWFGRNARNTVRIERDGQVVELTGQPAATQERLVHRLVEGRVASETSGTDQQ